MAVKGRFFSSAKIPAQKLKRSASHQVIDVGGGQFHAAAVALIDYLQTHPQVGDDTLKKILGRFYQHFPQYITNDSYLTLKERMEKLLKHPRKSELVESFAYVLREITVDHLYAHSTDLRYRPIFSKSFAAPSKDSLRQPGKKMPPVALIALSEAIDVPIILSFKEPGKELRARKGATDRAHQALNIQVQGKRYYPAVRNKANFAYVGQLNIVVKPVNTMKKEELSLATIREAIHADNQRLLLLYTQYRNKILSMVHANEVSYEQLFNLYIKLLPTQFNNSEFIIDLADSQHPMIVGDGPVSGEERVMMLANALASWVAAGVVSEEQLFEPSEQLYASTLDP